MRWLIASDEYLRIQAQNAGDFLGRKFGARRERIVKGSAWLLALIPPIAVLDGAWEHPIATSFGVLIVFLLNGLIAFTSCVRGLHVLQRNEDWGTYTNWVEWQWLRRIELFFFPLSMISGTLMILDGEITSFTVIMRPFLLLALLYGITIRELPPRKPRQVRAAATAHVGAG